ncbi:MAG: hypothetical protein DMF77_17550 [Acidobacteria bacterium]|nr:MAG: hypothetical protein DMF77_17550 [Acidobacteriota bacterium]
MERRPRPHRGDAEAALPPDARLLRDGGWRPDAGGGAGIRGARPRPPRAPARSGAPGPGAHAGLDRAAGAGGRGARGGGAPAGDRGAAEGDRAAGHRGEDRAAADRGPRLEEPAPGRARPRGDGRSLDPGGPALRRVRRPHLGDVARHVVETNGPAARHKSQSLDLVVDGALPVFGDADRLVEVVENLVGNAIKYSPLSSKIVVTALSRDGRALVEVKDAGPGLSEDDKRRMFGRFQRLSATPTAGEPATGLGLSIAKQLAELMGGEVSAASAGPGQGACFTLAMPLAARG